MVLNLYGRFKRAKGDITWTCLEFDKNNTTIFKTKKSFFFIEIYNISV